LSGGEALPIHGACKLARLVAGAAPVQRLAAKRLKRCAGLSWRATVTTDARHDSPAVIQ
jgi:hypothetical protein